MIVTRYGLPMVLLALSAPMFGADNLKSVETFVSRTDTGTIGFVANSMLVYVLATFIGLVVVWIGYYLPLCCS